jgi:AbrB family looped-hinge helix DNA binding protein
MGKKDSEIHVYGVGKVSPKGQIVIPADLRAEMGIETGDQLVIAKSKSGDGIMLLKIEILNRLLSGTRYNID